MRSIVLVLPWVCFAASARPASSQVFVADTQRIPGPASGNASYTENVELADFDGDGDVDIAWADGGQAGNLQNRLWVNAGGAQGATNGYFTDQTAARWLDLGQNNAATLCSSLPPQFELASGGFVEWSCDAALADLDQDGALDLLLSTYGVASTGRSPSRLFVNDGAGRFREFNPSCT